jgi:hypothetical protein
MQAERERLLGLGDAEFRGGRRQGRMLSSGLGPYAADQVIRVRLIHAGDDKDSAD